MFDIFPIACLLLIFFLFKYYYHQKYYQYWSQKGIEFIKPSFPFGNIASIVLLQKSISHCLKDLYQQVKGPYAGIYFVSAPGILLKDPEIIKHVLVKDFNHFTDRGFYIDEKSEPRSGHLFRLRGDRWKRMRSKLTAAFSTSRLKIIFQTITVVTKELDDHLQTFSDTPCEANVQDLATRYAADIIASSIYGITVNSFKNKDNEFFKAAVNLFASSNNWKAIKLCFIVFFPELLKYIKIESINVEHNELIANIVKKVSAYREANNVSRNDIMQLLLEMKNQGKITEERKNEAENSQGTEIEGNMTMDEIVAQAYTFFFAGFETSAITIAQLLYECAINQDIQERLQQEIDDVLDRYNGAITYESLSAMKYLDRVLSETLRKYPVLGYLNRICVRDYFMEATGMKITEGTRIVIPLLGLHHDPNIYPDPDKFDPDRFLPENCATRHPSAYLPFGDGPRNCIGKKMGQMMSKAGVATVLKNCTVTVCDKTQIPIDFTKMYLSCRPSEDITLNICKRKIK